MKILIDTHCWLWAMQAPEKLGPKTRKLLENDEQEFYFSAASAWEVAIKFQLGRLKLPQPPEDYLYSRLRDESFIELPVSVKHAARVAVMASHHRDPFDRILVAQAVCEGLQILTSDRAFEEYDVPILWANR